MQISRLALKISFLAILVGLATPLGTDARLSDLDSCSRHNMDGTADIISREQVPARHDRTAACVVRCMIADSDSSSWAGDRFSAPAFDWAGPTSNTFWAVDVSTAVENEDSGNEQTRDDPGWLLKVLKRE